MVLKDVQLRCALQGPDSIDKAIAVPVELQFAKDQPIQKKPVLSLEAIVDLVRASATEISGSEMDEDAHFANHHFDSLSAVELANSIGRAVGLSLAK